jgi:cell division transport system permease protein
MIPARRHHPEHHDSVFMIRVPFRAARRLPRLAGDRAGRLAPWLVALMIYVAGLAGIGLILVDETLRGSESLLSGRLTVQVPAEASAARIETVLAVLRQTPGIRSVRLLTAAETSRLLEPWLGAPVSLEALPVPRLIDAGLDPAIPLDMARLGQQLASVAPGIRIDDHRPVAAGLRARALPLQALLGAAIGSALLLVAAVAAFATGAALAARRSDIELLHLIGADDRQIGRPYTVRALVQGLIGAGIAAAAILASVAALGDSGQVVRPAAPVEGMGPGDWRLWAVLAAMILAAGILAAASAHATVRRRLARLP